MRMRLAPGDRGSVLFPTQLEEDHQNLTQVVFGPSSFVGGGVRDGCLLLVVSLELRTSWGQSVLGGRAAVGGLRTLELASSECVCSKLLKGGQARRGRPARTWPTLENAPIHQLHCETSGFVLAERSHPRQETGGGGKRCDKFDAVFFFF